MVEAVKKGLTVELCYSQAISGNFLLDFFSSSIISYFKMNYYVY